MGKNEVNRFRDVLAAKVAELERLIRQRDGIKVERSADQLEEIQAASQRALAVCNLDRDFNQLRGARAALRRIEPSGVTSKPASWGHLKTGQFVDHHPGQELVLPCLLLFWLVWLCSTWFQSSSSRIGR